MDGYRRKGRWYGTIERFAASLEATRVETPGVPALLLKMSLVPINVRDSIGSRGEIIFSNLVSKCHSEDGPIFRPQFLGDKMAFGRFYCRTVGCSPNHPLLLRAGQEY